MSHILVEINKHRFYWGNFGCLNIAQEHTCCVSICHDRRNRRLSYLLFICIYALALINNRIVSILQILVSKRNHIGLCNFLHALNTIHHISPIHSVYECLNEHVCTRLIFFKHLLYTQFIVGYTCREKRLVPFALAKNIYLL